jgi:hypothetical protein
MANFSITNSTAIGAGNTQQSLTTTYKTLIAIGNSSNTTATGGYGGPRRLKINDIIVGTNGTPADNEVEFDLVSITFTASVSGVSLISSLSSSFTLDPADSTLQAAIMINSSAEAGVTALTEKWYLGANQRASFRDVVNPGQEFVFAAAANSGFALRARSAGYTGTVTCTIVGSEL